MAKQTSGFSVGRSIFAWSALLFGFTGVGVLWLWAAHVNPDNGFSPAIIVIAYASSLAAILTAWLVRGAGGLGPLLRQVLVWRVSLGWYALALLMPLALVFAAVFLYVLGGGKVSGAWLAVPASGDIGGMIGPLIAGALGEEIGWRGFAQRLLQQRFTVLTASLLVGLFWATWHLWPIIAPGGHVHATSLEVFETYARLIATAVLYGWIFARTKSVLLPMLAHAGHNIAVDLVPSALLNGTAVPLLITILYGAVAIAVIVARPGHFLGSPAARN
ncbi:MAG TPA: type II CAAX endopeptidase family protein [Candidatus Saccharimonadales bacterium]